MYAHPSANSAAPRPLQQQLELLTDALRQRMELLHDSGRDTDDPGMPEAAGFGDRQAGGGSTEPARGASTGGRGCPGRGHSSKTTSLSTNRTKEESSLPDCLLASFFLCVITSLSYPI
eukprot:COSAG03_NODE_1630_length_3744_cov_5.585185_5_plen_118_part_00